MFFYNAYKYIHLSNTKKASVTVKFEQSKQSKQILMHPGTGRGPCFHVPQTITLLYVQENMGCSSKDYLGELECHFLLDPPSPPPFPAVEKIHL